MSKKKNQKRKQEKRRLLRKESSLIQKVLDEQSTQLNTSKVPESVTTLGDAIHDGEPYLLSFSLYMTRECELDKMVKSKDRDPGYALCILKELGFFADNLKKIQSKFGYTLRPVKNGKQYGKLYKGLHNKGIDIKDTIIYEAYIKGKNDGRMFFWVFTDKRIIYILAIRKNHYK